ncbi:hypothetical protein RR46_11096 [Papilio xuthus]|uniref:Uncharacterized protein n=1 Tax=Papilio xuthus TaxID=66420 RepID=A0A194Q3I7_PAPXU|nr:hypothetical protein RR46_11096 [Papilio xuthus]
MSEGIVLGGCAGAPSCARTGREGRGVGPAGVWDGAGEVVEPRRRLGLTRASRLTLATRTNDRRPRTVSYYRSKYIPRARSPIWTLAQRVLNL